jgi:crossover junction endodeoxyribonuclease RusA
MLTFTLPYPPSINRYYRAIGRGRVIISADGRDYRDAAMIAVRRYGDGKPLTGRLFVRIELYPPDNRKRDIDNVQKPLLDALTHARVWVDDSQIDMLTTIRCGRIAKPGSCVIVIGELDEPRTQHRTGNSADDAEARGRAHGKQPRPRSKTRTKRLPKDSRELGENDS